MQPFLNNPTNNALLINLRLSSDAEILLISTDWARRAKTCTQCVTYSDWASTLHTTVGGREGPLGLFITASWSSNAHMHESGILSTASIQCDISLINVLNKGHQHPDQHKQSCTLVFFFFLVSQLLLPSPIKTDFPLYLACRQVTKKNFVLKEIQNSAFKNLSCTFESWKELMDLMLVAEVSEMYVWLRMWVWSWGGRGEEEEEGGEGGRGSLVPLCVRVCTQSCLNWLGIFMTRIREEKRWDNQKNNGGGRREREPLYYYTWEGKC